MLTISNLSPKEQISCISICQAVVSNFLILLLVLIGGRVDLLIASIGFFGAVVIALCYFFVNEPKGTYETGKHFNKAVQ